jgi:hypothetical protein
VPIEAGMHNLMPEHGNVIRYLGFNVQKRLKMVRIYTEFAELGDLAELWITHTDLSMATDQGATPCKHISHWSLSSASSRQWLPDFV